MSGPAVGSLADEAAQLLDAVTARLERFKRQAGEPADSTKDDSAGPGSESAPTSGASPASEEQAAAAEAPATTEGATAHLTCVGWCPICRGSELLSGDRPEMTEKLVDTALLVLGTLRTMIAQHGGAAHGPDDETHLDSASPPGPVAGGPTGPTPKARPGVERIDIR